MLLEDITRFRLLDEVKSNLVATVSHELKTPLTSIRIVLHLLLEEHVGPLVPKQLELLVDARDNAERLLAMINNLLDLARLEQGRTQLRLRPEGPAALLQAAADSFRPRAEDRGVALLVEERGDLTPVAVDAEQFQHALHNLLDNALKHTPQGGRITLAAEPAGEKVVFSVSDTGSGIAAEYLPLVFEKYFRVPGEAAPEGSGLGLAIVRENCGRPRRRRRVPEHARRADRLPPVAAGVEAGEGEQGFRDLGIGEPCETASLRPQPLAPSPFRPPPSAFPQSLLPFLSGIISYPRSIQAGLP